MINGAPNAHRSLFRAVWIASTGRASAWRVTGAAIVFLVLERVSMKTDVGVKTDVVKTDVVKTAVVKTNAVEAFLS